MPDRRVTGIEVKEDTWKKLLVRKSPGDSFDDVINDLLETVEKIESSDLDVDELLDELED